MGENCLINIVVLLSFFSLMYNDLVGGALALTKDQFTKANGWSNLYWGWGVSLFSISYIK
jgi:hypothetical protein